MPIITKDEIAKSLKLEKLGPFGIHLSNSVMSMLYLNQLNVIYDKYNHLKGIKFIDAILQHLGIEIEITDFDLKKIPSSGPFIAVSNHPLGAIDGLIMLKILLTVNPESKVLANFILTKIKPLEQHICPVNPFETRKEIFASTKGLRQALSHIQSGIPLGIFPAGEVSMRTGKIIGAITDKTWSPSALKFIKKLGVPIVPICFNARNSHMFYWMSSVNSNLRTARLPAEIIKSQNKKIKVRIGFPISKTIQENINSIDQFNQILREQIDFLKLSQIQKRQIIHLQNYTPKKKISPIPSNQDADKIERHFDNIIDTNEHLFVMNNYRVFFLSLKNLDYIKRELGRLREITFREVGEGTSAAIDLDIYDDYYHHLILWDDQEKCIVGAYRLGLGQEIYRSKGLHGFYTSELFHYHPKMEIFLQNTIEMGRSFIVKSHQHKALPLFLLWKGIMTVTTMFPNYKYLMGAASISNSYSDFSKSLMVNYLSNHYIDKSLSKNVDPKHKFVSIIKKDAKATIEKLCDKDFTFVDKFISNVEPLGNKMPVLIKKYLSQEAKIIGYNVDPNFNNSIDVLMYLEIEKMDKKMFER